MVIRMLKTAQHTPLAKNPRLAGFLLSFAGLMVTLLMVLPVIALLWESMQGLHDGDGVLQRLSSSVLTTYISNSVMTVVFTLIFACSLAIPTAWWCSRYEFVGRRWLQWLPIFPLAIPAYIAAYVYTDMLDYAGPVQSTLRQWFGWQSPHDYYFPDIRTLTGASVLLAFTLFPYLYLLLRHAFDNSNANLTNAARLLGASKRRLFFTLHLPMARPALAMGCTLIAMETLADYGTVKLFAVSTLTTAVYDSWLIYGSLATAAQIASLLLLFVLLLTGLERYQRQRQRFYDVRNGVKAERNQAGFWRTGIIWCAILTIVIIGFALPVSVLFYYAWLYSAENLQSPLLAPMFSSFSLGLIAAFVTLLMAILLNARVRFQPGRVATSQLSLASLGYAIPGTVLAIGLLIPFTHLDFAINNLLEYWQQAPVGLVFSGTSVALVVAYVIRFAALANGTLHARYQGIPPSLDQASQLLGDQPHSTFWNIHLPLLRPAMLSALLLVFIECIKELPASLLLRPFELETLATFVFQYASDEHLEHAALAALFICLVSLLPLFFLSRTHRLE